MNEILVLAEGLSRLQSQIKHSLLGDRAESEPVATSSRDPEINQVISALEEVGEVERYLQNRRTASQQIVLDGEPSIQDLLFIILRPWIQDLVDESPGDKIASRFVIKDFKSKTLGLIVEAKFVRDPAHGKSLIKEINDDIAMYGGETQYEYVVFFIYDPGKFLRDARALKSHIEVNRTFDGRTVTFRAVIRPT